MYLKKPNIEAEQLKPQVTLSEQAVRLLGAYCIDISDDPCSPIEIARRYFADFDPPTEDVEV